MGIDLQQSEFPTRGFPTASENDPETVRAQHDFAWCEGNSQNGCFVDLDI
jgi:hypothetical protein